MRQCIDIPNVQRRIKKIEGQLRAISEMVEKDVACEDILIQINASKSALHKVGQLVLEGHLHHCVREGIEHGDAEKTISEFAKAIEHFSRME
jgi:DNA-binding FrmR family transcriptional regulator